MVYLFDRRPKPKIHPDYDKDAKAEVMVDNENCRFEPHVPAIRTGQTLVRRQQGPDRPQHQGRLLQQQLRSTT